MLFEKISNICKEKGICIAKLEEECGLGNATVRRWNTSTPRLDSIKKVANYLGVSLDDLLTEERGEQESGRKNESNHNQLIREN